MKKRLALIIFTFATGFSFSQISDRLKDGLKFYTNSKDSSHFIKLNMCSQIQARYTENNPGSLVNGFSQGYTSDVAIRRIRFVASGQLSDRIAFYMQFGQNSLTYLSTRKAGAFFHDVTTDYAVIKKYFYLGFGLNGWNGPSRFSNTSVATIMPLDPPGYQEVTNDTYDQFVRRLGVYAKGKIGKLDYRLSAAKPFAAQTGSAIDPVNTVSSTFSVKPPNLVYQGYLMYQFLDQESNFGPGTVGSYLGKKRIFNIGAGFYTQQKAMMYLDPKYTAPDTVYQDITLFAADVFWDMPLNTEKGNAISVYAAYSSYNYGTNFLRIQGPANPANNVNTAAAAKTYTPVSNYDKQNYGNAVPYLGTGNILYAQLGYKFKDNLLGNCGTFQPYANAQYAVYDRLADPMLVWCAGINWLVKGNNSKFTIDYQNRPYYTENAAGHLKQQNRYGMWVLQYQVAF
ncbi:MAG: hypothetical protein ACXVPQ_12720 [Bacteroidia bacterium]